MNKELQDYLDKFILNFLNEPSIKQYLSLKEKINQSKELKELNEKIIKAKKTLALSFNSNNYEQAKKDYESLNNLMINHPLIVNFEVVKEEVAFLIDNLVDQLKTL